MIRKESRHITFQRGMVETWKQDAAYENQNGAFQSALWLENYNPNLEHMSLVKRWGQGQYQLPIDAPTADKLIFIPDFKIFSLNLFGELGSLNSPYEPMSEIITHSTMLKTINPSLNNTFVLFCSRNPKSLAQPDFLPTGHFLFDGDLPLETTGVIASCFEWDTDEWRRAWHEPFADIHDFPGWYTLGTYQDSSRYGESLLFVTKLAGLNTADAPLNGSYLNPAGIKFSYLDHMYPCYVWRRWDITRKREKGEDRFWNGLTFSPDLVRNETDAIPAGSNEAYARWKVKNPAMSFIRENKIGAAKITSADELLDLDTLTDAIKDISIVFWENDAYSDYYFNQKLQGDYEDIVHLRTFETLNNDTMNQNVIDLVAADPDWSSLITIETFKSDNQDSYEIFTGDELHSGDLRPGNPKAGFKPALVSVFPDYMAEKLPRPWFMETVIPFAMTAIVNGVEILLYKGVYEIQNGSNLSPPTEDSELDKDTYTGTNRDKDESNAFALDVYREEEWKPLTVVHTINRYLMPINLLDKTFDADRRNNILDNYQLIYSSLRISENGYNSLLENDVTSLKFYVSKPDIENNEFKSFGYISDNDTDLRYAKALVNNENIDSEDNSVYALVKEYIIEGKGKHITDHEKYKNILIGFNGWKKQQDLWSGYDFAIWAVPQEDDQGLNQYPKARQVTSALPFNPKDVTGTLDNGWTTDFCLWDYPADRPPLALVSSGEYSDITAAGLIEVVKGRSFIGKCLDKNGKRLHAIIYYSAVQGGVASPDIFNKEDFFSAGHDEHTAFMQFREQFIAFSRYQHYRVMMPNVFDTTTWEFLDVSEGQGTFSPKTLCKTPYGYVWGNENGIWISDGRIPESLTDKPEQGLAVSATYQKIATNRPYEFLDAIDIGTILVDDEGINPSMEILYDKISNELIVTSPVKRTDYCSDNYISATELAELTLAYGITGDEASWEEQYDPPFSDLYPNQRIFLNDGVTTYALATVGGRQILTITNASKIVDGNVGSGEEYSVWYGTTRNTATSHDGIFVSASGGEIKLDITDLLSGPMMIAIYSDTSVNTTYMVFDFSATVQDYLGNCDFEQTHEIRMIFSFAKKNWRMEATNIDRISTKLHSKIGRMFIESPEILSTRLMYYDNTLIVDYGQQDKGYDQDIFVINDNPTIYKDIWAQLITHEIGDGQNDSLLHSVLLEGSPRDFYSTAQVKNWVDYEYPLFGKDPILSVELRNKTWNNQVSNNGWIDLIEKNMGAKAGSQPGSITIDDIVIPVQANPFTCLMQTSGGSSNPDENMTGRESLIILAPLRTKFRRSRYKLCSEILMKVRDINIRIAEHKRRSQ